MIEWLLAGGSIAYAMRKVKNANQKRERISLEKFIGKKIQTVTRTGFLTTNYRIIFSDNSYIQISQSGGTGIRFSGAVYDESWEKPELRYEFSVMLESFDYDDIGDYAKVLKQAAKSAGIKKLNEDDFRFFKGLSIINIDLIENSLCIVGKYNANHKVSKKFMKYEYAIMISPSDLSSALLGRDTTARLYIKTSIASI